MTGAVHIFFYFPSRASERKGTLFQIGTPGQRVWIWVGVPRVPKLNIISND